MVKVERRPGRLAVFPCKFLAYFMDSKTLCKTIVDTRNNRKFLAKTKNYQNILISVHVAPFLIAAGYTIFHRNLPNY